MKQQQVMKVCVLRRRSPIKRSPLDIERRKIFDHLRLCLRDADNARGTLASKGRRNRNLRSVICEIRVLKPPLLRICFQKWPINL